MGLVTESVVSHQENLRDAFVRMMDVCDDPVSREDLAYFIATYVIHKGLKADLMEKLQQWLEERDEYMRVDKGIENGG